MWLKTVHRCHLRLRMKSRYEQGASAPRHPRQRDIRRTSKQRGRLARPKGVTGMPLKGDVTK